MDCGVSVSKEITVSESWNYLRLHVWLVGNSRFTIVKVRNKLLAMVESLCLPNLAHEVLITEWSLTQINLQLGGLTLEVQLMQRLKVAFPTKSV